MIRRKLFIYALTLVAMQAAVPVAWSQSSYPAKPVRLVVPFPPGGPTDVFARQYASRMAEVLGKPILVDNKSGASGEIGAVEVKQSPPDGYTLVFGTASTHSIYDLISRAPKYDSVKDFSPISIVGGAPVVFTVNLAMPATLKGFIDLVRSGQQKLQYGSPGEGTYLHFAAERLKKEAGGILLDHIPYRGSAQTLPAVLGGQISMLVDTLGSSLPGHRAGKLRIVAVTSAKRAPLAPDVPTIDEAIGTKGFEAVLWNVVAAPANTPLPVINLLSSASNKVLADKSLHEVLGKLAIVPNNESSPGAAVAYINAEITKWRPVVEATGFKID